MFYKKKILTIEAEQVTNNNFDNILKLLTIDKIVEYNKDECYVIVKTLSGYKKAFEKDYIIKELSGSFDVMPKDLFLSNYELFSDREQNND